MIGPTLPYPDRTVAHLVAERARQRPDAVAVRQGGETLTYRQLLSAAGAVAGALRERGTGTGDLVGVCLDRRPSLVAAVLGVLGAGAGYVPLDPALPPQRLLAMAEEAGLRTVVGSWPGSGPDGPGGLDVLPVPDGARSDGAEPAPYEPPRSLASSAAVVLFTSGSTGRPKGVVLEHRAVTEFVTSGIAFAGMDRDACFLAFASIGFDAHLIDILSPLAAGATVALTSDADRADPTRLHRFCADNAVTMAFLPPPVLPVLDPDRLPGVRFVVTGGEATGPEQVARWTAGGRRLVNVYGPTETTVLVTWWEATGTWERPLPIGHPAANHRVHLVDAQLAEVAPGEPGELLAGGAGLARGYLGDPARTAERFVPDPFSGEPGARLYRTGDLVRRRPDGALEFLGRLDRQVKIRGQRIELGEVEAVVRSHPRAGTAAVEALTGPAGPVLVAYLTGEATAAEVRTHCAERLPAASVPATVLRVPELPITANGKTDFVRLRALAADPTPAAAAEAADEPPLTPVEHQVALAWGAVLSRPPAGREDDFFDHGGHSITAMRLVTDLRSRLRREVAVEDVMAGRTLRGIAARAAAAAPVADDQPVRGRPPALSPAQQRLWFLDRYSPEAATAYNVALAQRIRGPLDVEALAAALAAVVARQETLRWRVPDADGVPYAVVDPPGPVRLPVVELPPGTDVQGWLAAGAVRPFALATDRLWRAELLRLGPEDHVLAVQAHHAVFDGWSQALLYDDLAAAYALAREGRPAQLPALAATYGDYVAWRAERSRRRGAEDLAWWLSHLDGVPVVVELPTDRVRPAEQTFTGASLVGWLDADRTAALTRLAAGLGATPSAVLLAAFGVALAWCSGGGDLVVGTPTVDRRTAELEPMIGFFIDIAPLRLRLAGDSGFADHVRAARDELLAALAHPEAPLERIVDGFGLGGRLDRNPLVQVLFNMFTFTAPRLELPGLRTEPVPVTAPGSPFDLTLYGVEQDGRLRMELLYSTDVYDEAAMAALLGTVAQVIERGLEEPEKPVRDLPGAVPVAETTARPGVPRARPRPAVPAGAAAAAIAQQPATPTERMVAGVWCDVLGLPAVGASDSFFDVGGGSLTIVMVQQRLNRLLGRTLRVVDLFRYPTVRALAAHLDGTPASGGPPVPGAVPGAVDPVVARAASRGARRREQARRRHGQPDGPSPAGDETAGGRR
ncbi:MAG: amino acid adenylation domain-containing protein [Frankiaceae bacterium]